MNEFIVRSHPTNLARVIIFCLNKKMKMLAVNADLEVVMNLKPAKNFFHGVFAKEDCTATIHFCVMSMLSDVALYWDDELIIEAVQAFNAEHNIGILQTLVETLPDRMMFEIQRQAIDNVA